MIINENGWGNKPQKEVKEPVLEKTPKESDKDNAKKLKKQGEDA